MIRYYNQKQRNKRVPSTQEGYCLFTTRDVITALPIQNRWRSSFSPFVNKVILSKGLPAKAAFFAYAFIPQGCSEIIGKRG